MDPICSLKRKKIKDLHLGDSNFLLTCLVISKSDPKIFTFKDEQRGVFNLTLRDSAKDFLNCVIWGTDDRIHELNSEIAIGDVVNVENPKIGKENDGKGKEYKPKCSSDFILTIDSNRGRVVIDPGVNESLKALLKYPLKHPNEVLKLSDISLYEKESVGESVDLLVAVRYNRPPRELLIAKTGMKKKCKSVIVMDKTFQGMSLNLWSEQAIDRSEAWKELETILFITDVRINYSEYYQAITLVETARTLFIENPIGKEAEELKLYVERTPLKEMEGFLNDDMIDALRINDIMTVQQINDKADGILRTEGDHFTALCYATVTKFDIDGPYECIRRRCELCKHYISLEAEICSNEDCYNLQYMNGTAQQNCIKTFFNVTMNFSDHTGTLANCKLYNKFAEAVMGVDVNEFLALSDTQIGAIKWSVLLERCAVKLVIRKKSVCRARTLISVVEVVPVNPSEVSKELKIY